ncbi:MAG TPA: nucleotidyltransferase family protein [Gemmatimonadota bacterium]|nr:nucleotidyltransferase family protein [Gemmatimonadota bacterium]
MSVAGIVLAAGRSSRMGEPKALLEVDGRTFLERAIDVLADGGCSDLTVVLGPGESGRRAGEIARRKRAVTVENPRADAEQVDSLRIGLESLPEDAEAAIVLPVDHPLAEARTVRELVRGFRASGLPIVRPVYDDRPGHPVLFARGLWNEFSEPDLDEGAREVVHRHAAEILDVAIADRGVSVDIDTPEDYRREVVS